MNYWLKRVLQAQRTISDKTIAEIEAQLQKLYNKATVTTIADFEATYDKLLATIVDDREITPADLYKLDKYWQAQAQLKTELQKLGDKEVELLTECFKKEYENIYNSLAMKGQAAFTTIDKEAVTQTLNSVWCSDGKTWSQRIWKNNENLAQLLNDNLIHCVTTGKKTSELKKGLQEQFEVTYSQANRLVVTEVSHIETQAACDRYKSYGIKKFKFYADTDKKTCPVCSKLDGKEFYLDELKAGINAPPLHPRCRCCITPIDNEETNSCKKENTSNNKSSPSKASSDIFSTDDKAVFKAQELTRALQDDKIALKLESKSSHHVNHAKEITGIKNEAKAWYEYNKQASDFMKLDIDGEIIQGFISKDKKMYKYDTVRNLFGVLSDEWKIITYFKPDRKLDFWLDKIRNNEE